MGRKEKTVSQRKIQVLLCFVLVLYVWQVVSLAPQIVLPVFAIQWWIMHKQLSVLGGRFTPVKLPTHCMILLCSFHIYSRWGTGSKERTLAPSTKAGKEAIPTKHLRLGLVVKQTLESLFFHLYRVWVHFGTTLLYTEGALVGRARRMKLFVFSSIQFLQAG